MSDPHAAHGGPSSTAPAFTEAEWQEFQKADIRAATAFVILITSIFVTGVILYSIVLTVVTSAPQVGGF